MYLVKKEMENQFDALNLTVEYLDQQSDKICHFFESENKIIVFGCGSSLSVAKSIAMMLTGMAGRSAFAVAAGDYIVNEKDYATFIKDAAIISVSRSGSTSEIIRAVKLAKNAGAHKAMSICAVKDADIAGLAELNLEMPWIYDYSVCQTRTVNNLYASGLMIAALLAGDKDTLEILKKAPAYLEDFNKNYSTVFEEIAKKEWNHGVVLADSYMSGLAEEGALAFKEICQLNSNYYHILDLRHGPMVMINKDT
jgi:glucosamine--fructose-6-phosphate aminotransferase (isomerizing)